MGLLIALETAEDGMRCLQIFCEGIPGTWSGSVSSGSGSIFCRLTVYSRECRASHVLQSRGDDVL